MKLREASPCLNCEHLSQRVATLEDNLLRAMECIAKLEEDIENPDKSAVFSKYPKLIKDHHAGVLAGHIARHS